MNRMVRPYEALAKVGGPHGHPTYDLPWEFLRSVDYHLG